MDILDSLKEFVSPLVEFLDGYGIDLYSLLLGIIIVVAIALILRRRERKESSSQSSGASVKTARSMDLKGVRVVRPGMSGSSVTQSEEVVVESAASESAESSSAAASAAGQIAVNGFALRLRELSIQITLGMPAEVDAAVEAKGDNKPRKKPSKEDQWEQPPR